MNLTVESSFAVCMADLIKESAKAPVEDPRYNEAMSRIAKRQFGVTAKEIGATTLPLALGAGAGYGLQKYLEHTGSSAAPMARKALAVASIPAVGLTAAGVYRTVKDLKEREFGRIRKEELKKYQEGL